MDYTDKKNLFFLTFRGTLMLRCYANRLVDVSNTCLLIFLVALDYLQLDKKVPGYTLLAHVIFEYSF